MPSCFNVRVRINDVVCSCARALSFRGQRVHVFFLIRDGPRGFFGDCPGNPKLYPPYPIRTLGLDTRGAKLLKSRSHYMNHRQPTCKGSLSNVTSRKTCSDYN